MKSDQGGHGHPIGVFLHHNDKLNKFDGIIEDGLWMLEIFIYDPVLNRSGFYEDCLLTDY